MNYLLGLGLTTLLIFLGHWFPWPVKLHRLAAYVVGCLAIVAGMALWLLLSGEERLFYQVCLVFVIAGLATSLSYLIDACLRARLSRRLAESMFDERHD